MTACAPVAVCQAVAVELNAAVEAGTFTRAFTAVHSFGDKLNVLEEINTGDGITVDVVPHVAPRWTLAAHDMVRHDVVVKVILRRRLERTDREHDGQANADEIGGYCDLLYAILNLFAVTTANGEGRPLSTLTAASYDPTGRVVIQLYNEAELRRGLYLGFLHIPFRIHERM